MNALVFKPSRELIGRFEVASAEELPEKLQAFVASGVRVPMRSSVEAFGQAWTIVGFNPIQLREGQVPADFIQTEWSKRPLRRSSSAGATRQMAIGLAWCIGGIAVTVATYAMAANGPGGGTYVVAWGAIIFGMIRFFKGLAQRRSD
jgi:hypothetical protein